MSFILRLKELRINLNLSQQKIAKELGVAQNTYSNWEGGKREPSIEVLTTFCTKFNINSNWLLTGQGDMFNLPELDSTDRGLRLRPEEATLLSSFRLLPKDKQSTVINMVKGLSEPYV